MPLELTHGALRLALRPDLGGCIAGLWHGDLPVLRSNEPAALETSRLSACYPLIPYSGRLGYRRFRWHGQEHSTQPNFDASPHSVHGVAWQRPWQVLRAEGHHAELELRHAGDEHWPFAFTARQRLVLGASALTLHIQFENTDPRAQPVGLGWHPYFPKRPRSRVHAEAAARWETDPTGLPTRQVPSSGVDGDVAHLAFDHCFAGWKGAARVRDEHLRLEITSSLPYLVVFTPGTREYFCVEPVSHVANAVHMSSPAEHGLVDLAPGGTLEAWMKLDIHPAK
jgi:aldose 1-epimerase